MTGGSAYSASCSKWAAPQRPLQEETSRTTTTHDPEPWVMLPVPSGRRHLRKSRLTVSFHCDTLSLTLLVSLCLVIISPMYVMCCLGLSPYSFTSITHKFNPRQQIYMKVSVPYIMLRHWLSWEIDSTQLDIKFSPALCPSGAERGDRNVFHFLPQWSPLQRNSWNIKCRLQCPPSCTGLNSPANSSKMFKVRRWLGDDAACCLWNTQSTLILVFLILWAFKEGPHILLIVHWDSWRCTQPPGVTLYN